MPKPYPKEKSETLNALLLQGASNAEIKRVMGEVSKDILYTHRKRLHLSVRIRSDFGLDGEPKSTPHYLTHWDSCPKCGGLILPFIAGIERCSVCGLTNESTAFTRCTVKGAERVEI